MERECLGAALHAALQQHAAAGRQAFTGPAGEADYAALLDRVESAAAGFQASGLVRGAPVGVLLPRSIAGIAIYFGAMLAGGCPCFIEPKLTADALLGRMRAVGMQDLVLDPALLDNAELLAGSGIRLHAPQLAGTGFRPADLHADDRAMMLFTSGSTGQPKGVLLSHANLACNARGVIAQTGITPADRLLHVMPLFHTNGINNQIIAPLLAGATVILVGKFVAEDMPALIRNHRPTYVTGVPTIYARVLPHLAQHGLREALSGIRFLRCGSAPITVALHEQIEAGFGIPLIVSYGLSEATCTSTMNPPDARRIGSVGKVLPGQQVKLFAPNTTKEVPPGSEGEICIGGPSLMLGYLGADAASPIQEGWLRTGDLGQFDADGYLSITGRIKDVIIRGGENISPQMIENALVQHDAVGQCCVVGGPHADLGEVPVAFVVAHGACPSEQVLRDHLSEKLPRMYMPAEFRFVDTLPENGVGKVDRKALKTRLAPELA